TSTSNRYGRPLLARSPRSASRTPSSVPTDLHTAHRMRYSAAQSTPHEVTMEPRVAFVHIDDVPWNEVIAQLHGERRVSVHEKFLEWNAQRMVVLGRYDPHVVIERHGHASDHLVYVLDGELMVGDRHCPPGTLIVLEVGAKFGPL